MFIDVVDNLDAHLKSILEKVKLLYLLEREGCWDASQNWEDILSLGEQQRLGMVRLNFNKLGTGCECNYRYMRSNIGLYVSKILFLFREPLVSNLLCHI